MKAILVVRNFSAVIFLAAVLGAGSGTGAAVRVCGPVNLNWELSGCPDSGTVGCYCENSPGGF